VKFISVIVPCYNEENYIAPFIESLIVQNYQQGKIEVFIIDGMSSDKTRGIIREYCNNFPFITLIDNPEKIVAHALNMGIKASHGELLIRMDVHCRYPQNYLLTLVHYLFVLNADNVGGVCKILPAKETAICKSIAIGMSHKFGVGNSLFRIGTKDIIKTDTVPFGCFRRELFDQIGLFDEDLIRNQDDEFNARIIKNGGKIYLIPDILISYYARDKVSKMASMFYQYGLFKPLVNKKLGSPATIRQFFPLLFVGWLISGGIFSFINNIALVIYITVLCIYLSISFGFAALEARKYKDLNLFFLLPYIFLVIHLSYGWGYIMGIINFIILRREKHIVTNKR
jgi:glycosyltransferase involved in cell wall biosynthesis